MLDSSRFSATTRLVGGSFTFSGELAALSSGVTCPQGYGTAVDLGWQNSNHNAYIKVD